MFSEALDGGYTEWSAWTTCLASCGGGVQERFRKCSRPPPAFGGLDCRHIGPALESRECNNAPCPGKYDNMSDNESMDGKLSRGIVPLLVTGLLILTFDI